MHFKITIAVALMAVANSSFIPSSTDDIQGTVQPSQNEDVEEYDPHPQYAYSYGVEDAITGDSKTKTETRDGNVVHGEYSLNDADGYRRIVTYTSDSIKGFNAVVQRVPLEKPFKNTDPALLKSNYTPASYIIQTVVNHSPNEIRPVEKQQLTNKQTNKQLRKAMKTLNKKNN